MAQIEKGARLAGALSDAHHRVALALQHLLDVREHALLAVEVEGDLGDEANVHAA